MIPRWTDTENTQGNIQGILPKSDSPSGIRSKIPQPFRRHSDRFPPVPRNREFNSMSREIPGDELISMQS